MESKLLQSLYSIANSIDALAQPRFIDWLAVFLSVVSIIVSSAAIYSAIRVANKQNRIILFKKRYKIFKLYDSCKMFSELLMSLKSTKGLNKNDIQVLFLAVFCDIPMGEKINNSRFLRTQYITIIKQLKQSQFLFSRKIEEHLMKTADCLKNLINTICLPEREEKISSKEQLRRAAQLESVAQTFISLLQDNRSDAIVKKMKNTLTLK